MDYLGAPINAADNQLQNAANQSDATRAVIEIQRVLDKYCLFDVDINPESRVKVDQGRAKADLVEQGWRTFLVKVRNEAGITAQLKAESGNALPVFGSEGRFSLKLRPKPTVTQSDVSNRWLDLVIYDKPLAAKNMQAA